MTEYERDQLRATFSDRDHELLQMHFLKRWRPTRGANDRRRSSQMDARPDVRLSPSSGEPA